MNLDNTITPGAVYAPESHTSFCRTGFQEDCVPSTLSISLHICQHPTKTMTLGDNISQYVCTQNFSIATILCIVQEQKKEGYNIYLNLVCHGG